MSGKFEHYNRVGGNGQASCGPTSTPGHTGRVTA